MLQSFKQVAAFRIKQVAGVVGAIVAEYAAGMVADHVERILAARKRTHQHTPMEIYPGSAAPDWVFGLQCYFGPNYWKQIGPTYMPDSAQMKTRNGFRICAECKELYFDDVPPPSPEWTTQAPIYPCEGTGAAP